MQRCSVIRCLKYFGVANTEIFTTCRMYIYERNNDPSMLGPFKLLLNYFFFLCNCTMHFISHYLDLHLHFFFYYFNLGVMAAPLSSIDVNVVTVEFNENLKENLNFICSKCQQYIITELIRKWFQKIAAFLPQLRRNPGRKVVEKS